MHKSCLSIICLSLLTACSFEPTYERPAAPVASTFPNGPNYQSGSSTSGQSDRAGSAPTADIGWRDFFADPRLQRLISIALNNNRDLRIATLHVEDLRAKYQIQRSTLFPTVDALANSTTVHQPGALQFAGEPSTIYSVGVGVTSYELDFFGRVRSLKDQALQQYFSTQAARTSAQISLVAEVANAYLTWEANQELMTIAQETLKTQQAGFDMMTRRVEGRSASQLDLERAKIQVESADTALDQYRRQAAQSENELTQLIGSPIPNDLPPARPLTAQGILADLPAGLPSDMLERRPDIIAAEDQLKAANANIGAARAAFFPRITLTGTFGVQSSTLAGLLSSGLAWTFAPQITLPIFDAGSNKANLDSANVEKNIYVAQYEKTIQTAFHEVSDGLVGRTTLDSQARKEQVLVDTTAKSYDLSMMRYRAGIGDYFDALDTQRSLFAAQQTLVAVRLARLTNLVTLYKALGGGWTETSQQAPVAGGVAPSARPLAAAPVAAPRAAVAAPSVATAPPVAPPVVSAPPAAPPVAVARPAAPPVVAAPPAATAPPSATDASHRMFAPIQSSSN
jgi:multidrug efflux system outer membrane protein